MKLNIVRTPGAPLQVKLGATDTVFKTLVEGTTVDVDQKLADELIRLNLAEAFDVKGVATRAGIEGVPAGDATSPLAEQHADEAIEHISRMRSAEKLQEVIDADTRTTVVNAAKKRLGEL